VIFIKIQHYLGRCSQRKHTIYNKRGAQIYFRCSLLISEMSHERMIDATCTMYIYIHTCTYTYTYTCVHTHTHASIYIHIHTYTYTYIYIHISTYTCRKGQAAMWQKPYTVFQDVAWLWASNKPDHSLYNTPVLVTGPQMLFA
jgi:hypothetical protein